MPHAAFQPQSSCSSSIEEESLSVIRPGYDELVMRPVEDFANNLRGYYTPGFFFSCVVMAADTERSQLSAVLEYFVGQVDSVLIPAAEQAERSSDVDALTELKHLAASAQSRSEEGGDEPWTLERYVEVGDLVRRVANKAALFAEKRGV